MRDYFGDVERVWDELTLHADDFRALPGSVVVMGHVCGRRGDEEIRRNVLWTWRLRDGQAVGGPRLRPRRGRPRAHPPARRGYAGRTVKTLYTATATATDRGRNGHTRTDDGKLDLDLSMPEAMGGPGGEGTNPEQLFAAGYAACFANAMRSVARRDGRRGDRRRRDGDRARRHRRDRRRPLRPRVRLDVTVPQLAQEDAEELVAKAHERCPYSNATRGNIAVELAVTAGAAAAEQ